MPAHDLGMGPHQQDCAHATANAPLPEIREARRIVEPGLEELRGVAALANQATRRSAPVDALMVGLQCGGSDGFSGITATPALGRHGGATILSEGSEIHGAERLLTRRAVSADVGRRLIDRMEWRERYMARPGRAWVWREWSSLPGKSAR